MSTSEAILEQNALFSANFVSIVKIQYSLTSGWWAFFESSHVLNGRNRPSCWANSPAKLECMSKEERDIVMYVLAMRIRDRMPLMRQEPSPNDKLLIHWEDTGILWFDRINLQIRYFSCFVYCPASFARCEQ